PSTLDLVYGDFNPSGRLPVSWPRTVGQIPVHYNHKKTGRPANEKSFVHIEDIPIGAWQSSLGNTSHYLDDGYTPLFPFGYGLSYSSVKYSKFTTSNTTLPMNGTITASATVTNTGKVAATEIVQLYFQDEFASITRPVRQLADFKRVELAPGETQVVEFVITPEQLEFYNLDSEWVAEPGSFNLWIGPNAVEGLKGKFELVEFSDDKAGLD
ncbi:MAG: fibronectin type III-like domain-contianing protein, partial [bacterium]|nr:fibronectin type III-like domain-contianing protein [bacterium]